MRYKSDMPRPATTLRAIDPSVAPLLPWTQPDLLVLKPANAG